MEANFRTRISIQSLRSHVMEWRGHPFLCWGWGWGGVEFFLLSSCVWCGEWTVHCSLSTWTGDSRLSHASFLGEGVKSKSSQVPDMFPKEVPITPQFSPICFGKCCPPFTYIVRPKGRNSVIRNRTLHFGEPPNFFFFLVMVQMKLAHCKINKGCVTLWLSHLH